MNIPDFGDISQASRQVATQSAMNPILWKTVICSPIAIVCSVIAPSPLNYFILALAAVPILIGSWGFYHFAKVAPGRLQSEGHVEHMEAMRLGSQTGGVTIDIPANSPSGNNPQISGGETPRISSGESK